MASEIRANKQTNRVGLGTVTYTDTGIIVSGIVTTTGLDLNGDIDVDGHTNLDNVSIAGLSTHSEGIFVPNDKDIKLGGSHASPAFRIFSNGTHQYIRDIGSGNLYVTTNSLNVLNSTTSQTLLKANQGTNGYVQLYQNNQVKLETTSTGAVVTGVLTATSFSGDGSSLSNLPAGAPVGGASTNTVFFENDVAVAVNYQITSSKNAMSAGPIAINAGIAVTVPSGCSWTIV